MACDAAVTSLLVSLLVLAVLLFCQCSMSCLAEAGLQRVGVQSGAQSLSEHSDVVELGWAALCVWECQALECMW
eukprot:1131757-Amphidinium_carterae.1